MFGANPFGVAAGAAAAVAVLGDRDDCSFTLPPPCASSVMLSCNAQVFQHSMLHCGQELTDGLKYLCRSDVMFRQIEDDDGSTEAEATCDV